MEIDRVKIAEKYNSMNEIWSIKDVWHWKTHLEIEKFISQKVINKQALFKSILIAGSAGNSHLLPEEKIIHFDIAEEKIKNKSHFMVGSIEEIPFPSKSFDCVICVGSVVNYCDPILALRQFNLVTQSNGILILEFENSCTWELLGKNKFNKKVVFTNTFYHGENEKLWLFSENFIKYILVKNNYRILSLRRFHMVSPLIYRITKSENFAAKFFILDNIFRFIPFLRKLCSNVILHAEKCA